MPPCSERPQVGSGVSSAGKQQLLRSTGAGTAAKARNEEDHGCKAYLPRKLQQVHSLSALLASAARLAVLDFSGSVDGKVTAPKCDP
jgi:hypothetical protein